MCRVQQHHVDYSESNCCTGQDVPPYPPQLLAPSSAVPPTSNNTVDGRRSWVLTLERPVGSVADVTVLGQPLGEFFSRVNAIPDTEPTSEVSFKSSTDCARIACVQSLVYTIVLL